MQSCAHREPPAEDVDEHPVSESAGVMDAPVWISPGVTVSAGLDMPNEHERGVCRCDACRTRSPRTPRFA